MLTVTASMVWLGMVGCSEYQSIEYATSSEHPDLRSVTVFFEHERPRYGRAHAKDKWNERRRLDGTWVKEGPSTGWSRNGQKLEEGSYRDGKREGTWTYWNEDGSIDSANSGVYEGDVRVSISAPSPLGDYPVDADSAR